MTNVTRLRSDPERWNKEIPRLLDEALTDYDLTSQSEWEELAQLSNFTEFDGAEVYGESAIIADDTLIAPGNVYVNLNYGDEPEKTTFSDSYPMRIFFSMRSYEEGASVTIDHIDIDTSSFFGEEAAEG